MPTVCVLNMLHLLLKHTHFGFKGKKYIQMEGTAIGSHLGMNYACTYLGEWEQEFFEKSGRLRTHYWRYVVDVWGLRGHGLEKLQEFHKLANSLHLRIKTELPFSSQQI
jgi:hypothetical protein